MTSLLQRDKPALASHWRRASAVAVVYLLVLGTFQGSFAESVNHVIPISSFKYADVSIIVNPGDTVTWVNNDFVSHTATAGPKIGSSDKPSTSGTSFWTTGEIGPDETVTMIMKEGMTTDYFCKYHPSMKASLEPTTLN